MPSPFAGPWVGELKDLLSNNKGEVNSICCEFGALLCADIVPSHVKILPNLDETTNDKTKDICKLVNS